jgi:hypothetical protein
VVLLKHPIYFVWRPADRWRAVADADPVPPREAILRVLMQQGGDCSWTFQTYLELKRRGYDVHLQSHMEPDAICVAHYDSIPLKEWPVNSFIVAIRPDRPAIPVANMRIVQNRTAIHTRRDHMMYHWPQPGLLPRDPARGDRIENVVYMGVDYNLSPEFRTEDFRRRVSDLGMRFKMCSEGYCDYCDYRETDVILAVRPGTRYDIDLKPATKLYNAWQAGSPVLLGPESAYREIRKNEYDYVEIQTAAEAVEALRRLRDDPQRYRKMIENGLQRGQEFSWDATAQRWHDLLAGSVTDEFEAWKRRRSRTPKAVVHLRFAALAGAHKVAWHIHRWRI